MSDGSVIIDTKLDNKEFQAQVSKLDKIIDKGMKGCLVSIGAIATAITGIGTSALKFGTEYQQASNQLQASTGATSAEMENLKEVMKSVYANNFGEDMNDVANSIATVRKELGELDNTSLQNATQNAIALRDTFDYDVNESVRSAKALMDNFGISSDEAFNLISQGAQKGLDYSGELLDNISEYSVQFAKVGLDAEDMFDIFASGAENGAFNLDKIGDAVKEFSIRAIDGSNTTIEGFTKLGLNADEMAQKFAQGGNTAKEAFYQVIQQLGSMDDKVEQSKVGVDLFGTMWEDLGPEVVTQLGSMQGAFDQTKNSAESLTQIKYDDLGSAVQGIGRQIQTNLLLPIAEKLLPTFNDLANKLSEVFSSEEMQESIEKISNSISGLVSGIASFVENWLPQILDFISWIIQNAPTIISILTGITTAIKTIQIGTKIVDIVKGFTSLKNTITSVGGAFKALSSIFAVNPFVLIIGGIIGLVAGFITLWNTSEGFRNFWIGLWEGIKSAFETVWNTISTFFTETIPNAWNSFITSLQGLAQTIWDTLVNAWNSIVSFFTETIPQWIQNIITWFQQLPYNIGLLIGQILGNILNFGLNVWNWVTTELPKIIQNIINWFAELPRKYMDLVMQCSR